MLFTGLEMVSLTRPVEKIDLTFFEKFLGAFTGMFRSTSQCLSPFMISSRMQHGTVESVLYYLPSLLSENLMTCRSE